jgi:hypothetical protein
MLARSLDPQSKVCHQQSEYSMGVLETQNMQAYS